MLTYEPNDRVKPTEALAHPFLAEYHNESLEPSSTTKFNFDFENGGAHMSKTDIQKLMHGEMR